MKEDADRREIMEERLSKTGAPYEFVEAVNGRSFDLANTPEYNRKKRLRYFGRDMIGGEIGCLLSHRKIFEKMDKEEIPYAVVLEDDVIFEPEYKEVLEALIDTNIPWDVVRFLGSKKIYARGCRKIAPLTGKYWMARLPTAPGGAHGYILTLKAARTMIKHMQTNWVPVDTLQGRIWETGLETLVLHPAPLHIDEEAETTIGDIRLDKTLQIDGWQKNLFPVFRAWFKICETLGKRYVYWSSWPRDYIKGKGS
jgi:glycosyl transferase family 25